jgi:hypothetical protein
MINFISSDFGNHRHERTLIVCPCQKKHARSRNESTPEGSQVFPSGIQEFNVNLLLFFPLRDQSALKNYRGVSHTVSGFVTATSSGFSYVLLFRYIKRNLIALNIKRHLLFRTTFLAVTHRCTFLKCPWIRRMSCFRQVKWSHALIKKISVKSFQSLTW